MNGSRWHAAATEVAELVRTVGLRVVLTGGVFFVLAAGPVMLRLWVYLPRGVL